MPDCSGAVWGRFVEMVPVVSARQQQSARSVLKGRIASAICALPAVYWFGVMAFAVYNHRVYATAQPQLLRYIVVPGVLVAIFAGCAVYGSRVARLLLGGIGLAVLAALFAFEIKLQAASYSAVSGLVSAPQASWMQAQHLTQGLPPAATAKKLTRMLHITRLADSVLGGVPGERVLLCSHGGAPVIYRADRYGFRNDDRTYARPVQTMLLGDSFVEGICLPDGHDLVGRVRANHPATIGLGTRGAGPLLELAMLGRFGPAIRPRQVVIVFYEGNDWENLDHELRKPWLAPALRDGVDFGSPLLSASTRALAQPILDDWAAAQSTASSTLLLHTHIPRNFLALHQTWTQLGLGYPKVPPDLGEYDRVLARTRAIAAGWGGSVMLVYIPQTSRFVGALPDQFVFDQVRDKVRAATARNGIPVIDLTPLFLRQPDPIGLYAADGHLSLRGAEFAARALDGALAGTAAANRGGHRT